jgi:hypothetical protein
MPNVTEMIEGLDGKITFKFDNGEIKIVDTSSSGSSVSTVPVSSNILINTSNQSTFNGKILEFTGTFTVTIGGGLEDDFGFAVIPPNTGTVTIVSDGTTTLNGSTTSVIRSSPTYTLFGVQQRASNRNAYIVS